MHIWHRKYIVTLVLICTLIATGFAFAQDKEQSKGTKSLKLPLEEAIKLAEQENPRIHLSKLALEKAELARQEFKYGDRRAKKQKEELGLSKDYDYNYQKELGEKRTDFGVDMAKLGIDATVRNIRFGVETAYYGALSARDNTNIAEVALDRQKDLLRIAEAMLKAGTIAKKDVLDAQVQLAKAEGDLFQARSEEEKAYINLKQLLGISLNSHIKLTDFFEYKPLDNKIKLEQLINDAQKNRMDVATAQGNFDIAKLDFDWTSKAYPSNTFKYKEKEHALQEANIQLLDKQRDVEAEVRGIWLDFNEAGANIPVLDKSLEMAKESLRLAKLSYEAGIIRSVDVAAAEEGLKQVELRRAQVIFNYNLAKLKLENVKYISVI